MVVAMMKKRVFAEGPLDVAVDEERSVKRRRREEKVRVVSAGREADVKRQQQQQRAGAGGGRFDKRRDLREERSVKGRGCREEQLREAEMKKRQQQRAAARAELEKMEETADAKTSMESFRELEEVSGCSLRCSFVTPEGQAKQPRVITGVFRGSRFWNPLEKLGLRMKDDNWYDDEDEDDDVIGSETSSSSSSCRVDMNTEKQEECKKGSSPDDDKAKHAAMVRSRYSKIIEKAQQKTLFL